MWSERRIQIRGDRRRINRPCLANRAELVGWLLLGVQLSRPAIPAARVAGIALIGLAIACLPGRALLGMLAYSTLVTLYLGDFGLFSGFAGVLLWPAVAVHAGLTLLLARLWFKPRRNAST